MSDVLERATRALKEAQASGSGDAAERADLAEATRERILGRAELGRRERRVTRAILLPIAASFLLVASWAAASGALRRILSIGAADPAPQSPVLVAPSAAPSPARRAGGSTELEETAKEPESPKEEAPTKPEVQPAPSVEVQPAPSVAEPLAPRVVAPAKPRASVEAPSAAPPSIPPAPVTDALYAAAHRAHFEDHDWTRALSAWDAYLADAPSGRFAPEARYNRALCLIRLGRRGEAEVALRPIAGSGGYRSSEALQLLQAIDAGR